MPDIKKYDQILDALHQLLKDNAIQNISMSDITGKAGIGKGNRCAAGTFNYLTLPDH